MPSGFHGSRLRLFISAAPALQAAGENSELRLPKTLAGFFRQGLFSDATPLSLYQLKMAPQYDAVLVDLVARFAALERSE
jgi:hypothetical protein